MAIDITQPNAQDALSLQELELYHLIMDYRASLGLAAIPLSTALTTTAGRHVADTRENIWGEGVELPAGANLHSWSNRYYYRDNSDPEAMWNAPRRIGVDYPSAGYEISAAGFETVAAALEGWKGSASHNAVLANLDVWASVEFKAIGIGVDTTPADDTFAGRIFHVWFGESADPNAPEIAGTAEGDRIIGTAFADTINGRQGDDEIRGGAGDDRVQGGGGSDRLLGEDGDDILQGGDGDDLLQGGAGSDRLLGGGGADELRGGAGDDRLFGGAGDDVIIGGGGVDVMTGGAGSDTFVWTSLRQGRPDSALTTITDFERRVDRIDLSAIDAIAATEADDAFVFISDAAFSGTAGELRRADGIVEADTDGDAIADFRIELRSYVTLVPTDTNGDGVPDIDVEVTVVPRPVASDFIL